MLDVQFELAGIQARKLEELLNQVPKALAVIPNKSKEFENVFVCRVFEDIFEGGFGKLNGGNGWQAMWLKGCHFSGY